MDELMDGMKEEQKGRWMEGGREGLMDGFMEEVMNGWMDGWMERMNEGIHQLELIFRISSFNF